MASIFHGYWQDFKAFAVRGNVIDLAVGVVIGAAFNNITNALVKGLISPPLGYLTGGVNLGDKQWTLVSPTLAADGSIVEGSGVVLQYGMVLEASIDFFIMAITIFTILRFFRKTKEEAEDPKNKSVPTPKDIELLSEISEGIKQLNASANKPSTGV